MLALLVEVEAGENLTIARREFFQNAPDQADALAEDGTLFRTSVRIGDAEGCIRVHVVATVLYHAIDVRGDGAADDGTDEAHQAFGLAQLSPADGLHYDQERIVNFVFEFLGAQLTAQIEANAL